MILALQVSGTRVVFADDPCGHCGSFFTANLGFKAIAMQTLHRVWPKTDPRPLGVAPVHRHARDLDSLRRRSLMPDVAPRVAWCVPTDVKDLPADLPYLVRLPSDDSPVQPPHLHSKK